MRRCCAQSWLVSLLKTIKPISLLSIACSISSLSPLKFEKSLRPLVTISTDRGDPAFDMRNIEGVRSGKGFSAIVDSLSGRTGLGQIEWHYQQSSQQGGCLPLSETRSNCLPSESKRLKPETLAGGPKRNRV